MNNNNSLDWLTTLVSRYSPFQLVLGAGAAVIALVLIYYSIYRFFKQGIIQKYKVPQLIYKFVFKAGLSLFMSISLWLAIKGFKPLFHPTVFSVTAHFLLLGIIISVGILLAKLLALGREISVIYYGTEKSTNFSARKVRTQFKIIEKVLSFVIVIATIAFALMTFDSVRQFGTTLLASAGVIGIIIGFAAQKSISTLVAGIQIAISQPIRIDDEVVLEGEWGRIEEITLTYVVVNIWDKRRLIVPINYFLEKPFQNWTRTTSELLATVFLYMDYTVPVDAIREELTKLLANSEKWDGKLNVVQITNATALNIEVRLLVSAANSGNAFDLRCEIREGMIKFLQANHPEALPKTRIEMSKQSLPEVGFHSMASF